MPSDSVLPKKNILGPGRPVTFPSGGSLHRVLRAGRGLLRRRGSREDRGRRRTLREARPRLRQVRWNRSQSYDRELQRQRCKYLQRLARF
jgi:hypothetical protein